MRLSLSIKHSDIRSDGVVLPTKNFSGHFVLNLDVTIPVLSKNDHHICTVFWKCSQWAIFFLTLSDSAAAVYRSRVHIQALWTRLRALIDGTSDRHGCSRRR